MGDDEIYSERYRAVDEAIKQATLVGADLVANGWTEIYRWPGH
jgi:hypothetical protein